MTAAQHILTCLLGAQSSLLWKPPFYLLSTSYSPPSWTQKVSLLGLPKICRASKAIAMISATSCYPSELLLDFFICPSVTQVPLVFLASIQTICERFSPRQQTNSLWKAEVTAALGMIYQVSRKGWSCVSGTWSEACGSCSNTVALKASKTILPQDSSILAWLSSWGSPEKKKKAKGNYAWFQALPEVSWAMKLQPGGG